MGTNNKQRRAAKARKRARQADGASHGRRAGRRPDREDRRRAEVSEEDLVDALVELARRQSTNGATDELAATIAELVRCSPALVAQHVERDFARILPVLWRHGWLPGEVIRQTKRATSANGERLVACAIAADHRSRDPSTLHPAWSRHVDQLCLPAGIRAEGWLRSLPPAEIFTSPLDWPQVIELASVVSSALRGLTPLIEVVPPPGATFESPSIVDLTGRRAGPILSKVRHLLAQAESTNFDAEAEAFTAKAQELMARHAIDAAVVWDRQERAEEPTTIRLPVDDPYIQAKSLLLGVVADAMQCRAVFESAYALVNLIGFESDLVCCETLYTSLLVQAQRELTRAGAAEPVGGRRRSRLFRSSFLTAYSHRIGERLDEVNAHVEDEFLQDNAASSDPSSSALLPILASRRAAVDDAVDAQFDGLVSGPARPIGDYQGWSEGRLAADRANLARGDLESRQAS